jgi:hypothetical protein
MNFLNETLESILDNQRKEKNKKGDKKFPLQTKNNIASKLEQKNQEKQGKRISIDPKKDEKKDKKVLLQTKTNIPFHLEQKQEKQEDKISIGFDIDEVISNYPYGFKSKYSIIPPTKAINIMRKCSLGKKIINFFYLKRKPIQSTIDFIAELKEKGYKIVLITGFQDKDLAEKWLSDNSVQYDGLYLWNGMGSVEEYKSKTAEKLQLKIFIDNSKKNIKNLSKTVTGIYCKKPEEAITEVKKILNIK